jgi:hypothetical protein
MAGKQATMRTITIDSNATTEDLKTQISGLNTFLTAQQTTCKDPTVSPEIKQQCALGIADTQKKILAITRELTTRYAVANASSTALAKKGGSKRKTTKGRRKQNKSRRNRKSRR